MVTNLDKVLTGLQIVHTWLSVQKKYDGLPPEFCADAEVYVKRSIDLIKNQAEEIKQLQDGEALVPVWRDGKAYCKNCGMRISLKVKPRYCYKCGRKVYFSEKHDR